MVVPALAVALDLPPRAELGLADREITAALAFLGCRPAEAAALVGLVGASVSLGLA